MDGEISKNIIDFVSYADGKNNLNISLKFYS